MDRLQSMTAFIVTADTGSFAAAARQLSLTPAMVGRQVRWLEDRLRVQLVARTTRRQSLTEAGQLYLEHARMALSEVEAAERSVTRLRRVPSGVLRVDAPQSFGASALAPALGEFTRRYPDIVVELTLNNRLVDLIEEGYDAAIRAGQLPDSGLIAMKLAPYELVACASPEYVSRRGMPDSPERLREHECLRFRPRSSFEVWRFRSPDSTEVEIEARGKLVSNSGHALRAAALAGAGVILQSKALVAEDLRAGTLVRVVPGWEASSLPLQLVYAGLREPAPKLRAFIDFMVERFVETQKT